MGAPLLPTEVLDHTGLTRLGLEDRLQTLFRQVNPGWDDFSSNHQENLILHGQALIGSLIAGVSDERVRQLSWATVSNRLAAIRNGRATGFTLIGRTAATLEGYFSLPNSAVASSKVLIPAGTRISSGQVIHTTLVDMDIEVGNNASATQSVENSEEITDQFQSMQEANIVLKLSGYPVIDGSLSVSAGNGAYTRTNPETNKDWASFLEMTPDTMGFKWMQDDKGKVYVIFGNSVYGVVPTGAIQVTYKVGGGEDNPIETGAKWQIHDTIYSAGGDVMTVNFTNTTGSEGGRNEMSVQEARVLGPQSMHTISSATNEDNFEYAARKDVGSVARAALMTSEHDSAIQENAAVLYIVSFGAAYSTTDGDGYYPPATPTSATLSAVQALYEGATRKYPKVLGMTISYSSARWHTVAVKVKVYKASGYTAAQVKASVLKEVRKFFAVADADRVPTTTVDFAYKLLGSDGLPDYKLAWSHIFNVINDAPGVREIPSSDDNLLLNGVRGSVVMLPPYFPLLGSVQVYDMDQGGVEI